MIEKIKSFISDKWRKKSEILDYLDYKRIYVNERQWRKEVEKYDMEYCLGLHDSYIVHSSKGYMLTSDRKIIEKSKNDDKSRLIALAKRVYGVERRFKEMDQLTLFPSEEIDAYEVLMRMKV